jgi:FtsZ-binding cell division protein ZapB
MAESRGNGKKDNIYIGVLASLGVILVIVVVMYYMEHRDNKRYISEITTEKVSLENELKLLSQDYDSLQTSNDTLNVQLKMEQEKISELLDRMKVFRNNSYFEINKYKRELGTLKGVLRDYIVQIDSLNTRNQLLTAENKRVKKQIDWVKDRNTKLEETSESMKEVISRAATLSLQDLNCKPINKKGKDVRKISKTVKLVANFTLQKNVTASTGAKEIFIRITRPDEVVLGNPENLLFDFENTKLGYSAKREIDFEGEQIDVAIFWDNDGSLIRGEYKVDVFAEGNHLGTARFLLK